jgi:hypothetical protein
MFIASFNDGLSEHLQLTRIQTLVDGGFIDIHFGA